LKVIAIASLKGGVGKTALSVLLSNEASNQNKDVLSIDLDSQASLTDFYLRDVEPSDIFRGNAFHFLSDQKPIQSLIHKSLFHSVLPAALNLAQIGAMVSGNPIALKDHSEEIRSLPFDYIFIDCPPSPCYEFRLGIAAADIVLVPISLDRWSIQGLTLLLDEAKKRTRAGMFNGEVKIIPSSVAEKEGDKKRESLIDQGRKVNRQ